MPGWPGFDAGCCPPSDDPVGVPDSMRALERAAVDDIWSAVAALLPAPDRSHPLGGHRPRAADRLRFPSILIRLVTGASSVDVGAILDRRRSGDRAHLRR